MGRARMGRAGLGCLREEVIRWGLAIKEATVPGFHKIVVRLQGPNCVSVVDVAVTCLSNLLHRSL